MIALLERGVVYPPLDICVGARPVCDAISAADICEPAGSGPKFHPIPARDRMTRGFIRRFYWVDVPDMLADGVTKGGVDRTLSTKVCNECRFSVSHEVLMHSKRKDPAAGSVSILLEEEFPEKEEPQLGRA